jgi:anti-sigma28 factor (negative regulator of flagellin synthesis)
MTNSSDAAQHDAAARIMELRREIARGTYETDEKLSAALDAFLDQQAASQAGSTFSPARKARPK